MVKGKGDVTGYNRVIKTFGLHERIKELSQEQLSRE